MVLLFRRLYELRAKEAAAGERVIVVGPPGAGKTTFIKQFLEPLGVEAAEETAGLAPGGAAGESLVQRLRRSVRGRYVRGDEVEKELAGIRGAELLKAFDKLPRDFVEHLKERYGGWSLYLFYIPPDAEYEEVKRLRAVMEEVGVEFRWFGLSYLPPGLAKVLAEKGEDYVRRQLKLYKELAEELDIAEGRLRKAAESALESLLGQVKEVAERLIDVAAPGAGVAVSILTEVLTALLFSRGGWGELVKLVARLGELDEALRRILAARLALALGLDRGAVEKALATLAGADVEKLAEEVKALKNAADKLWVEVKSAKRGLDVLFLEDVELGGLYENFVVLNERPYVDLLEGLFPLVAGGRFEEEARWVLEKLESDGVAVLIGPKGIGKSTLAAYVVWRMLRGGEAEAAVRVEKSAKELTLKRMMELVKRGVVVLYDPSPLEVYYKHKYMEETERPEEVIKTLEELADFLQSGGGGVRLLVVLPTDLYEVVKDKVFESFQDAALEKAFKNAVLKIALNDVEFLHSVIKTYSSCGGDYSKLAEEIAQLDGGYTLVAKYAGLWLRERGCDAGDVERAVEEARREPKLFFAHYIWHVLLRGSGDLAKRVAVPLLLHAYFGPVLVGVTYITKAVNDRGIWRFLKPEDLKDAALESLREDELEPIAKWLTQKHEDFVKETLRDLAGLNDEEAREPYREALGDLIKALDWARGEVLNEGAETLAELGVPKEHRVLWMSLLVFVNRRLAAVFKSGEGRSCWRRIAFIAGYALAGYRVLPRRVQEDVAEDAYARGAGQRRWELLSDDVAEVLGDAWESCAVDAYLTIDSEIPPLSIFVVGFPYNVEASYAGDLSQIRRIRERLGVLSPLADAETINAVKKTVEELMAKWERSDVDLHEVIYALGLTALAAGAEVDEKTADWLLYAASFAVQEVAHPAAVLPILAALRPLGEKAPHKYVSLLAAASELRTLGQKTVEYIYDALRQLKDRLTETGGLWPLVEAIRAYSNLMRRHPEHIGGLREEAVADMCELYSKVKGRDDTTACGNGLSAQRLFNTIAKVYVLAVALGSGDLAQHVQEYCGLGDLEEEAKNVMCVLNKAAAHPEELRKIMESDVDFADWARARDVTEDAKRAIEDLRAQLTYVLARYKLNHALDAEELEEVAKEFEKVAEIRKRLEQWGGYLIARSLALRARVLAAGSWGELLERAGDFRELWEEAKKHLKLNARYLSTAALPLGEYLVYLAASGDKSGAEELLKKRRWLLNYDPRASANTRLMLRLFGVGDGAKLEELVKAFKSLREFQPALLMLACRLQKDEALRMCGQLSKTKDHTGVSSKAEDCVNAVKAAAGDQEAVAEILRSEINKRLELKTESETQVAHLLLDKVDGKTLVEVLTPMTPAAQLAFMLLAAVEGRADAVRLHGLWGFARFRKPLLQQLSHAVYENCGDLNSEGCRLALLKLYYYHV